MAKNIDIIDLSPLLAFPNNSNNKIYMFKTLEEEIEENEVEGPEEGVGDDEEDFSGATEGER